MYIHLIRQQQQNDSQGEPDLAWPSLHIYVLLMLNDIVLGNRTVCGVAGPRFKLFPVLCAGPLEEVVGSFSCGVGVML